MSEPKTAAFLHLQLLRLDGSYHSLMANEKVVAKQEALAAFDTITRLTPLASYALTGLRADCDLLLWRAARSLDDLQEGSARLQSSGMGKFLAPVYSFLGLAPDLSYLETPPGKGAPARTFGIAPLLIVQPAIVAQPADRAAVLAAFAEAAKRHPKVRLHAIDSSGMDDHDFVFVFEAPDAAVYAALALELKASKAASLLTRETPVFAGLHKDVRDIVDQIGS